jgi:superfamily II DNA or RNA helicase
VVLLSPFDRPVKLGVDGAASALTRRAWMAALRCAVLGQHGACGLLAPVRADIELLPHQLEPALAVVRHGARRLLLADAVGLGKTIEAGLVLAELRMRSGFDRVLVLAPPGLCDQWAAELTDRFGLECAVADAAWLRARRAVLPAPINPWSVPGIHVVSMDFAKRPEVRRSLEQVSWDGLVVDEAHLAAGDSERKAAAHALACRSRLVLLLTATPHSGDPRAFRALCGIGALADDDPLVMFRRDRADAGIAQARRVHLHRIRSTPAERDVRRSLDAYVRRVWSRRRGPDGRDARLAMIVLLKRSLSGMTPLRRSLLTRLDRLGVAAPPPAAQLELRWDDELDAADEAPSGVLGAPGLDDAAEERSVLKALADLARAAEAGDSKRLALLRLLGRLREPAIVFTEYRDTLAALQAELAGDAAVLHGAMDRVERAEAVRLFNRGGARVLLATDAAGEGLNLQHACRVVVNLELPWNPMRLEQRIGRVDRIGQRRRVHAINLVAAGTAESVVLSRLACRVERARAALGPVGDVLGGGEEVLVSEYLGRLDALGITVVDAGIGYWDNRGHAPDEHIRIEDFLNGARHLARIIEGFSR